MQTLVIVAYFLLFSLSIVPIFGDENIRYYNKINFRNYSSFTDFKHELLELSPDGELVVATNLILGVSTPECTHSLEDNPAFKASIRYAGGDVLESAWLPASEFPYRLNHCAEVLFYRVNSLFTQPIASTADIDHRSLSSFIQDHVRTSLKFVNKFPFAVDIVWSDESKEPTKIITIQPDQQHTIQTFIGHTFSAHEHIDSQNDENFGRVLDFFVVNEPFYEFHPENRLYSCEAYDSEYMFIPNHCQDMETRYEQFKNYVWHQKRLGLNYVQPKFVPQVTPEGFLHRKLPSETYSWLKAWYDEELARKAEIEGSAGPCMNQAEAPSLITHLTPDYKDRLSQELKPILYEWYNSGPFKGDIRLTSIYGIRQYTNGSVLRMHVDTVNTHVVSAIINVDQDIDRDWPLLILDHEDNEHYLTMQPGDMVLYESAKLLHGRPDYMIGKHYDNIFIHYSPLSGWDYGWV